MWGRWRHGSAECSGTGETGTITPDSGLFFTREDGSPIHPERFSDWFRQHVKAAGLPTISLHKVRHSHATALLRAGIPTKVVSQRLGHASVGITKDVYQHVLREMDQKAANAGAAGLTG